MSSSGDNGAAGGDEDYAHCKHVVISRYFSSVFQGHGAGDEHDEPEKPRHQERMENQVIRYCPGEPPKVLDEEEAKKYLERAGAGDGMIVPKFRSGFGFGPMPFPRQPDSGDEEISPWSSGPPFGSGGGGFPGSVFEEMEEMFKMFDHVLGGSDPFRGFSGPHHMMPRAPTSPPSASPPSPPSSAPHHRHPYYRQHHQSKTAEEEAIERELHRRRQEYAYRNSETI